LPISSRRLLESRNISSRPYSELGLGSPRTFEINYSSRRDVPRRPGVAGSPL